MSCDFLEDEFLCAFATPWPYNRPDVQVNAWCAHQTWNWGTKLVRVSVMGMVVGMMRRPQEDVEKV